MDQINAPLGQEAQPKIVEPEKKQTEETPIANSMEMFLQGELLEMDLPKQGEIRTGVIASISEHEILVSVGTKSEGVIAGREKEQIPPEESASFHVGQEIPVYILNPEDSSGNLILSYIRAREEQDWQTVESMLGTDKVYESSVIGFNKGGLIVPIGNLRGFVPASQISVMRRIDTGDTPDERWGSLVGDDITVRVIEVDRQRHRLILSERLALQETRETIKERLLDDLREGEVRHGRVTSLADFGAFVNIDGVDGLVHLSEISWERIDHPSQVLKVGQDVQVKVILIDRERKRIGLSIRQLLPDPWLAKIEHLREGQLVEGTITHLTKFGAFARLGDEMEGLIHISELSEARVNHPKEVVKEGDVVTLRIIKLDAERRRIGLSLRKVDSPAYADLDWKMALSGEVEETQLAGGSQTGEEAFVEVEETQLTSDSPSGEEALVEVEETQLASDLPSGEETPAKVEETQLVSDEQPLEETPIANETTELLVTAKTAETSVEPESDTASEAAEA